MEYGMEGGKRQGQTPFLKRWEKKERSLTNLSSKKEKGLVRKEEREKDIFERKKRQVPSTFFVGEVYAISCSI